jgi:hypothetical protein
MAFQPADEGVQPVIKTVGLNHRKELQEYDYAEKQKQKELEYARPSVHKIIL